MKIDGDMVDLELKVNAVDEATQTSLCCIDLDLEALDGRVNHRRRECKTTEAGLRLAKGRIELLEGRLGSQSLGAEGVLPGRYIESLLRVFKQFTHTLPSG